MIPSGEPEGKMLFASLHDQLRASLDAENTAVEANVVILRLSPVAPRIVFIIDLALLILLREAFFGRLITFAVTLDDPLCAAVHIRVDKNMQAVLPIPQNIVRAAPDNHAVSLCSKLLDDLRLLDIQAVIHR